MSSEATVWLIAGIGVGIALSILALALFAAAERRAIRRWHPRAAEPVPPVEVTPVPAAPVATPPPGEPAVKKNGDLNVHALFAEAFATPKQPVLPAMPALDGQTKLPPSS